MCGIGGFIGSFDPSILDAMSSSIQNRGPDDSGVFYDSNAEIGLFHRRLSIIDLSSKGHQPMRDQEGKLHISFNGEIYNYQTLRAELAARGCVFLSDSDTEVLLHAYNEYGLAFIEKLQGIFAFVLWDSDSGQLLAARDHFGVKPFYYSLNKSGFIFSSEIKALLMSAQIERDIDVEAIMNHLVLLYSPGERTMLQAVKKLQPGHALLVDRSGIQKHWKFYDLPYGKTSEYFVSPTEAAEEVRSGLERAVAAQLMSDVPIGAFLSGGLDSSSIVAMARKSDPGINLDCFTVDLGSRGLKDEGFSDDLHFARKVAQIFDLPLHEVAVDADCILRLPEMIYHLDEPHADPAPLNVLFISELAKSSGIKVLLSGAGGDDLFGGYRRHVAVMIERYWQYLPQDLRHRMQKISGKVNQGTPLGRRLKKAFQYAALSPEDRLPQYFSWADAPSARALLSQDLQRQLGKFDPVGDLARNLRAIPSDCTNLQKLLYLEAKGFLPDLNLNYTDKAGMAAGVEIRVPFLDEELVDIATRVPDSMKVRGTQTKWILKKAMKGYLPSSVIFRPKTGFGAPIRYWMKNQLSTLLDEVLSKESIRSRGVFDADKVWEMIDEDKAGLKDWSYVILSVLCIEIWFRTFLDSATPEVYTL